LKNVRSISLTGGGSGATWTLPKYEGAKKFRKDPTIGTYPKPDQRSKTRIPEDWGRPGDRTPPRICLAISAHLSVARQDYTIAMRRWYTCIRSEAQIH